MKISKRTYCLFIGVLALGVLLRLVNIGSEPFWSDEILSLDIFTSFKSFGEMVHYLRQVEFHPPLYYLLMRSWSMLFGVSHFAIRFVSLLFGMGVIAVAFFWSRKLFRSDAVALITALSMALLPFQIEFSQEARPYIIFTFFGILATWMLWEYLRTEKNGYAVGYVVSILAGLYLHYSFIFLAGALALWWFLDAVLKSSARRSGALLKWLVFHAIVFIGFWFWLDALLYKMILSDYVLMGEVRAIPEVRPFAFIGRIFDGLIWTRRSDFVPTTEILVKYLAILSVGAGIFQLGKERFLGNAGNMKKWWQNPVVYLMWILFLPIGLFIASPQSIPYTELFQRHVIFATVPLVMLFSHLVVGLGKKKGAVIFLLVFASMVPALVLTLDNDGKWNRLFQHETEGAFLSSEWREGDIVIAWTTHVRSHLSRFLPDDAVVEAIYPLGYFQRGIDPWRTKRTLGLIENEMQVRAITIMPERGSDEEALAKTAVILKRHHPRRVWIYASSVTLPKWFSDNGWRRVYRSIYPMFRLDLFEAPTGTP